MARNWCFTDNNYVTIPDALPKFGTYAVLGKEIGDSGTRHLQGYIEFSQPVRYTNIQKWLGTKAHCEMRAGTRDQARDYCMKDGDYIELGEYHSKKPGTRTDLNLLYDAAKTMPTLQEVCDAYPVEYMKFYKAVAHIRSMGALDPPSMRLDLQVLVAYGPPGTGKTKQAYEHDPQLYSLPLQGNKDLWFDGYNGQKTVLMDDFNGQLKLDQLLRLLDVYPIQVPCKGSFLWFKPDHIIITTNTHPKQWYDYTARQDSWNALKRRIHHFVVFKELGVDPVETDIEQ